MSSSAAFHALTKEITCSLCGSLYHRPHSFAGCGHSFCYTCVMGKLSEQREGQCACPSCKEPVSVTELYFNHKCQSIVKAVQGLQQILTVGTSIDKENSHGAANAAQMFLANRPSSSHHRAREVSHRKDDISVFLHKSGGVSGMGAQASHQYGVAASNMAEHVKQEKPDLPCPEGLPASLLQYDQAWAASVAVLPPPDAAETAELAHELLMIADVLEDLRKRLKSIGHDAPDMHLDPGLSASPTEAVAQGQAEAACVAPEAEAEPDAWANNVPDDGLTSKHSRCLDSSEPQQVQSGGRVLPPVMAAHSMLYGTDRSLGDIDAVMQARGYRLSCMPGPSDMPQTFVSCDIEAELEIKDSPSGHQNMANLSPWPAPVSHDSDAAHTRSPLNAVPIPESPQIGLLKGSQEKAAPAAAEAGGWSRPGVAACAQSVASASLHHPAESMLELLHSCNAVHEQANLPNHDDIMTGNGGQATADTPAAHTAIPAVLVDTPQAANQPNLAQAPVRPAAAVTAVSSPVQVDEQESLVLPDSAGPSEQAQTSDGQQPELPEVPASSVASQSPSENASLEAALALAALATGERGLNTAQTAASLKQGESPAQDRRHRSAQQKQCKSSHMPLKAIQRTAVVQRQPLKPAWQHSSKVTAGWGSKGQRTRSQKATVPQKGRKNKQRQQGSQAADTGTKAWVSQVDEDERLCGKDHIGGMFVRTTQGATGSQQEAGHTGSSSKQASAWLKADSSEQAEANKAVVGDKVAEAGGQSQSVLRQSPSEPQQDSDDDADDFKPDIRRRPRARQSPQGSRKRARVSAEKAPSSVPVQQEQDAQEDEPIGQALLRWNDANQQWSHEIITGFSANKGKHCVRGQAGSSHWVDLSVVTWLRPGRPPVQKVLIRQLVNHPVEIWWPEDKKFYKGAVIRYIPDKGKHLVLYDDGEEEDLNMAKEQFQFCPPLPKLEQEQQPGTESQAQAKARPAISKDTDLATASSGGKLVTDTAFEHDSEPRDHVDPPANAEEHPPGPIVSVKSYRQPQLACSAQGHAPPPIIAPTSPQDRSDIPFHMPIGSAANAVGACEAASASQTAAGSLPDSHPVSAETREEAQSSPTKQIDSPHQQPKPASDAYNYTASQAEATGAHQQLLNARTDVQVGPGRGRKTGRKRLPVRQAAAAKRQKQLPSSELKAGRGRKTVKQAAQPPRQATRLAKASSQKLALEDNAPDGAAVDAAEAGHTNSADQLLQQKQQAALLQKCDHGELSDKSQLPLQQDSPKQNAAHQLLMAPSEQMQQQLSELAVQQKLPEAPAHVLLPADQLLPPQRQAAVMPSGKKVVIGSGLDRAKLDQIRRLCRRLRADACKAVDQHTTHVIVQVNARGLCQQRSLKYFQGLAQGCWLVGWAWLEACAAAGRWVPEEAYEVAGDHVAVGAPKAARMARESGAPKLFHGRSFLMGCGYKGSGLSPQQLAELLTHAGGCVLDHLSADLGSKDQAHDTEKLHVILFGEGNIEPEKVGKTKEQTGRWPLLLSWVLDSLSHQTPLPVAQYEERGQLRDTI
ncbi:hypothetical protein WJX77_010243 [Trebouxia sp. C0004]